MKCGDLKHGEELLVRTLRDESEELGFIADGKQNGILPGPYG